MDDFAPHPVADTDDDGDRRNWLARSLGVAAACCLPGWAGAARPRPARAHHQVKAKTARRAAAGAVAATASSGEAAAAAERPGAPRWRETGLPAALVERLAASGLPVEAVGLYSGPIDGGVPLLSLNADRSFVLASTAKVVTALAGLQLLGPDYRWRTRAYLQGSLKDGTLHGDLLIVGGGDARLDSEDLQAWFVRMQRAGLRRIAGNIVLDRSAFQLSESDHQLTPEPGVYRPHHVRPDALSIGGGVLRVSLQPDSARDAAVTVQPPLQGLRLVNHLVPQGGCSAHAELSEQASERQLQLRGRWGPQCGSRQIELAPMRADELSVLGFGALWQSTGGQLDGSVVDRAAPARGGGLPVDGRGRVVSPWSVHTSAPLMDYIQVMNKHSHNLMARHLMLSLAPQFPRRPATLGAARRRLGDWLRQQGLADGDIEIDNGSGLSRGERARPEAMAQLLRRALALPESKGFLQSLPVAGVDGTLQTRLQESAAHGQAYLKTGSLTDTRALAGYVRGSSGRWQVFMAVVNHPHAPRATKALDDIVDWVARHG